MSRRRRLHFLRPPAPEPPRLAPRRLHRLLRVFPRRGHLGLHRRSFPEPGARQRPEPRQLLALVHERRDLARLPRDRPLQRSLPLRLLLGHDGRAARRRRRVLPRDQRRLPRRNAAQTRNRLNEAHSAPCPAKQATNPPATTSLECGVSTPLSMRSPRNKTVLLALLLAVASLPLALAAQQESRRPQQAKPSTSAAKSPALPAAEKSATATTPPGSEACAKCHSAIAASYSQTAMARASGQAIDQLTPADFTHAASGVHYRVYPENNAAMLSFDRPDDPAMHGTRRLQYFIGSGHRGRTYLFSLDDFFFESPINWYAQKRVWDTAPAFQDAKFMPMNLPAYPGCLNCHTSASRAPIANTENKYDMPLFAHDGITCERCHGDNAAHIATGKGEIVNPSKLPPARRDDVCMQCHLEGNVAIEQPHRKLANYHPGENLGDDVHYFIYVDQESQQIRALGQSEALWQSVCKVKSGDKMTCTTCHDPHSTPAPAQRVAFYRAKCLTCHTDAFGAQHHADQPDCTSCHMPRSNTSNVAHTQATDHRTLIRARKAPSANERRAIRSLRCHSVRNTGEDHAGRRRTRSRARLGGDRAGRPFRSGHRSRALPQSSHPRTSRRSRAARQPRLHRPAPRRCRESPPTLRARTPSRSADDRRRRKSRRYRSPRPQLQSRRRTLGSRFCPRPRTQRHRHEPRPHRLRHWPIRQSPRLRRPRPPIQPRLPQRQILRQSPSRRPTQLQIPLAPIVRSSLCSGDFTSPSCLLPPRRSSSPSCPLPPRRSSSPSRLLPPRRFLSPSCLSPPHGSLSPSCFFLVGAGLAPPGVNFKHKCSRSLGGHRFGFNRAEVQNSIDNHMD